MKLKLYFLFLVISLTVFFSCSSKKEAKELFYFFEETEKLNKISEGNYINASKKVEKELIDNGSRPSDTLSIYGGKLFIAQISELQLWLDNYYDTLFFKRMDKDYNFNDFDTLALLNNIILDTNYFKILESKLQNAVRLYGYKALQEQLSERHRKFQFLQSDGITYFFKLPRESKTGLLLLAISSLKLELNELRYAVAKRHLVLIDHTMKFGDVQPFVRVKSNVVEAGEEYKAEIFLLGRGHGFEKPIIKINGSMLPLIDDVGALSFRVTAGQYDSTGLAKKKLAGEASMLFKGRQNTFEIEHDYYVKKKCDAK